MAPTNLVHFVDEDQRILGSDLFQCLDGLSGHSSDVCTSMALDFGNVSQTTDGEPGKLPESGYRLTSDHLEWTHL
jgi:hypothetical protein